MKFTNYSKVLYLSATCLAVALGFDTVNAQVPQGAVYVQTNALDGNEVAAFGRNLDGTLFHIGDYATGGLNSFWSLSTREVTQLLPFALNQIFH